MTGSLMRLSALASLVAASGCADDNFASGGPADAAVDEVAVDASPETVVDAAPVPFCKRPAASGYEQCDDFESGVVGSAWPVDARGGTLSVSPDAARDSSNGMLVKKSGEDYAHVMTKLSSIDATGATLRFAVRLAAIPENLAQSGFVAILAVAGSEPLGVAVYPRTGGGADLELFGIGSGTRVKVTSVVTNKWIDLDARIVCTDVCESTLTVDGGLMGRLALAANKNAENAVQVGLNVGSAGGDYVVHFDDVLASFTR